MSYVYGDPSGINRSEIWERLSRIGVCRKGSWCMLGDFNDILHNGEKTGVPVRNDSTFVPEMDFSRVQGSNQSSILDVNPFLSVSIQ